jgi:hypothetical protein
MGEGERRRISGEEEKSRRRVVRNGAEGVGEDWSRGLLGGREGGGNVSIRRGWRDSGKGELGRNSEGNRERVGC